MDEDCFDIITQLLNKNVIQTTKINFLFLQLILIKLK
jgi:hypothetical protein